MKMTKNKKEETSSEEKSLKKIVPVQKSTVKKPFTNEQVALIKRTVAKGATDDELKLFLIIANKSGLDPFSKQIYFVKRKAKINGQYVEVGAIQTGIDGYRAIAERGGGYAGSDEPIYDSEDAKNPNKATVTVYKIIQGVRCPFTAAARWSEYCPPTPMDFMWRKMPYLMLGKTAEALALRKAFPNDLSGIHIDEEMDRTGQVITDANEVTVQTPSLIIKDGNADGGASVDTKTNPLDSLFETARNFGAKKGQESLFIQETLAIEIDWDQVTEKVIANLKTQLMSKLTPR